MLCSRKEMPVCYVAQVTYGFMVSPCLRQKQFQGTLHGVWSEAEHDYGLKIYCCAIRKTWIIFNYFILKPNFELNFFPFMLLPFSDLLYQTGEGSELF